MKTMYKNRLLKLAKHLESGRLGHKVFTMKYYNAWGNEQYGGCGTHGCAIGECPIIFPRSWKFDGINLPVVKGQDGPKRSGMKFFGISALDYMHLFAPEHFKEGTTGRTRKQEARVIRNFVRNQSV